MGRRQATRARRPLAGRPGRGLRWLAGVAPALVLASCGGGGGGGGGGGESVVVQRDKQGVPHVFATTDRGALFGLGFAVARDRLLQMTQSRLAAQGRVAEYFGPGTVVGIGDTYVQHDREARLMGWYRHAVDVVSLLDASTLDLLQAYCDGVNAFMTKKKKTIHPVFSNFKIPLDPWTPEDCVAVWLRFARHFGGDGTEEVGSLRQWETLLATLPFNEAYNQMIGDVVCDEEAAVVQEAEVPASVVQAMNAYAATHGLSASGACPRPVSGPKFSQAWAVAGARTTTGKAVLVGEPRGEVFKPNSYYEWSIEGETLAVRGIGVAGSPLVLAGSTPSVAWSPTALGMDQGDLFSLVTDSVNHPGQYLLDGFWLDYSIDEVETVVVRNAPNVFVRYRETVWGPVVTPVLEDTLPGEEFALHRSPQIDPLRDTSRAFAAMLRATDVDAFVDALRSWNWPSLNVVCADADGRIAYTVAGDVPVRRPNLTLAGVIPQDGSTLASAWIGRLPWGLQPHVFDPAEGVLFSANHMPVGAWYPIPISLGTGGAGETHRSRRLRELLGALPALATPDEVSAPRLDVVHPARRDFVELGLWLRDEQSTYTLAPEALSALTELEPWYQAGAPMDDTDRGVVVAWFLDLLFRESETGPELLDTYGGGVNGLHLFLKSVLADLHATPQVPLSPEASAYVDLVLTAGWHGADALGDPTTWLGWYQTNVLMFDVASFKTLEGFTTSVAPLSVGPVLGGDSQTLHAPVEQNYTHVVEPGTGTIPLSLLPPGVSELAGKLEANRVDGWEHGELENAPLTKAELQQSGGGSQKTVLVYKAPPR